MKIDTQQILDRLPEQRWFGWKDRAIAAVDVVDFGVVDDGIPALTLAVVRVRFDGGSALFQLPLLVEEDGTSRDAFEDVDRLRVFGACLAHGTSVKGAHGTFRFTGPGLDPLSPPGKVSARTMGAEQTNTSLVLDEQMIVKLFRRVDTGHNPDLELTRVLTESGFMHTPPHLGELVYEGVVDGEEVQIDLCVAQQFLSDSIEGWSETLKRLHQLYDSIEDQDIAEDMRFLTEERSGDLLALIQDLGEVTASLHVALSREELDPDIAPEPIERSDLEEWARSARASLQLLLDDGVVELQELAPQIEERIAKLPEVTEPGLKTRAHADYHLGQVLLTGRGWMILDFEGEPARTLEERRAKTSPLRDVAGMLRSFNYAATAALFERAEPDSEEWKRLAPWADTWETLARERFIHGYLMRSHEGRFVPRDRSELMVMLDVFEIDKALYEVGYERGHRPDWVRIPLHGIAKTLEASP
ncbi:MAG: phosphotransferase [Actinobacteria bacterium]|nr:phosphotransferase [Actinomycetota bacterium]